MNTSTSRSRMSNPGARFVVLATMMTLALIGVLLPATRADAGVVSQSVVADVWSVHQTGRPVLLTTSTDQYVAYYDADLYLTVAQRPASGGNWTYNKTAIQSNWQTGFHHGIAMQTDAAGNLHVFAAMHNEALKYMRTSTPGSIDSLTTITSMVGTDETRISYPVLLKDAAGDLYLSYRTGGSGNGNQLINKYSTASSTWSRLVSPLFDGATSGTSAYINGPTLGPDGLFHIAYVWRATGDVVTNYDLSYVRSADLLNWTTASGQPVTLPITPTRPGVVVDPVLQGGGLFNGLHFLGFDAAGSPTITYPKYDAQGFTQVYNARLEGGSWESVQATDWTYRWHFSGGGAIPIEVWPTGLRTTGTPGELAFGYQHSIYGDAEVVVSQSDLTPLRTVKEEDVARTTPRSLSIPETVNPPRPMTVDLVQDLNPSSGYILRWERGPNNNDSPVAQPWPGPTPLRVIKLNDSTEQYLSPNIAAGKPVTTSSSYEKSGWSAASLTDGVLFPGAGKAGYSSSASTATNHTEWVQIDLGSVRPVRQTSLFESTAAGLPVDYSIQVSSNGSDWTTVATRTGVAAGAGQLTDMFPATVGRYVRVLATSLRPNPRDANQYRLQLAEIEVMEQTPSVQSRLVPTASSTLQNTSWGLAKVVNGVTTGTDPGWSSKNSLNVNHQEWIAFDLTSARTVSRVDLYPSRAGQAYPLDIKIELSSDGVNWTTAHTQQSVPIPAEVGTYTFTPQSARYVRVTGTSLRQDASDNNQYRMQLAEVVIP